MVKAGKLSLRGDHYTFPNVVVAALLTTLLGCFQLIMAGASSLLDDAPMPVALPNCPDKCGNISIPYPFGIGDGCHYKSSTDDGQYYNLTCDEAAGPPALTYGNGIAVVNVTQEGELWIRNRISYTCRNSDANSNYTYSNRSTHNTWIYMKRFTLSTTQNFVGAIGCDTYVWLNGTMNNKRNFRSGCMTLCASLNDTETNNACSGIGCCLVNIPQGVTDIDLNIHSLDTQIFTPDFDPCSVAFVVAKGYNDSFPLSVGQILTEKIKYFRQLKLPIVYDWSISGKLCQEAIHTKEYICKGNSSCIDWQERGYRCHCKPGFRGNPYLHDCQDIDECKEKNPCKKSSEQCTNTIGNYSCDCLPGYSRRNDTDNSQGRCIADEKPKGLSLIIKIIGGIGGGIIVFLLAALWYDWYHGNKKLQKMKESFFYQNGGHILRQKLATRDVTASNMVQMFTIEELVKATDNYSEDSVIGRGGFGMVYKGTITHKDTLWNNQVVAIKRSLKVDSSQVEQFINEIVALSQINNRNVVKLLGCCLETEVPLLVYEYISNGTLYHHLHDNQKAYSLTWDLRLRIAAEVSGVLAYLHNTITVQIIHRDIKSANILLDDNYTAKVADFGASKLAPSDQEQLATMVQGTCGYLDPEYMQTGELTEKSDVYSFGVVLVELLTREKAICYTKPENERSLAVYFLRKLKEDRLFEILDDRIVTDGAVEQLKEVANLARRCLKLKGEDRPTMKQVARELDDIIGMGSRSLSNNDGVTFQEEREYLLAETYINSSSIHSNNAVNNSSSSRSSIVQLIPVNDGR